MYICAYVRNIYLCIYIYHEQSNELIDLIAVLSGRCHIVLITLQ